jgi:DNA-3-methyladenine glycosylase II
MAKLRGTSAAGFIQPRFIETDKDISAGVTALRRACPVMRRAHEVAGDPPLRRRPGGFDGLARIIVGQQLSTASAAAIWRRLEGLMSPVTPAKISAASEEMLRSAGLSAAKIRTLRATADAATDGTLAIDRLDRLDDAAVHEMLCAVKGIGPWTADIYIMFCLGRADAFAIGDLALQIAAGHAAGLANRPTPAELAGMAERWRPWRGVAARLLWAYYPHMKAAGRKGQGTAEPV